MLQRPHVPVILVFQSVCLSSKRQDVLPPLEMVVQGLFVPGALATRQPAGIGTWHWWEGSPLDIPKLHACSVVAGKSEGIWAETSGGMGRSKAQSISPPRRHCMTRMFGIVGW